MQPKYGLKWVNLMQTGVYRDELRDTVSCLATKPFKNSIWSVINRLVSAATVYFIWQERNLKLFRNESRTDEVLRMIITESVKSQLMSLKVKGSSNVKSAASKWGLTWVNMQLIGV